MNPICPDCGTPLERHVEFKHECYPTLIKWICPRCHEEAKKEIDRLMSEAVDDFSKKYRYVLKDGWYEIEEKK